MAKIPSASLPSTQYYVVEARRQIGADTVLPSEGVRIYHVDTTRWEQSFVVDPDSDSDVNEADSIFVPGESFRDPWSNTTIAVTAATASGYDLSITFDPAPCCGGDGLRATYFPNKNFTGTSVTRIDPTINFLWTDQNPPSSPDPAIPPDLFSARWAGELLVPATGMYTFYSTPDDGVRVWIGGKLIIDSWLVQAFNERRGKIALTGGQRVPVVVEYFEESGGAAVNLSWTGPNIPKMVVPTSRLFSAPATQSCKTAAAGAAWINTPFSSQNNLFTVEYDVTPRAKPIDAAVGLSAGAQSAFTGFATLTRFNTSGNIDVRNGGAYAADIAFAYSANQKYHFRLVGNLATKRYTVYVTPPGGSERVLALDYAFRSEQAGVTRLDSWGAKVNSASGSLDVCNFVLNASSPTLICKTGAAGGGFVNTSFSSQSGLFTAEYLGKASVNPIDGLIGLSMGAQTANTGFATLTRFNTSGNIDARNGSVFSGPMPVLPYVANTRYQYRLLVNVATSRYCAYVTAPGGAEQRIGEELSFRTEQLGVTSLSNYGVKTSSASGSTEACSFAVTPGP
jgi:hypothetical protein